ncbi:MAG TPA: GTP-binding protein [Bradyrhizobium sp.]|nr:GTP-binding protein [Bradyrhizobium sp.]
MSRTVPLARLRNIGILAQLDAGRTTTTERILAAARPASPAPSARGAAAVWLEPDARGITLTSAATQCAWRDHYLTIVELPGGGAFATVGERALKVVDAVVTVLDSVSGVEPMTETAWRKADTQGLARVAFVNKLDRDGADFASCVAALDGRLGAKPVVLQLPIGLGAGFVGVVDLVRMRATLWRDGTSAGFVEGEIPAEMAAEATEYRGKLIVAFGDLAPADMKAAIREATLAHRAVPVLCGSAFRNKGIPALLDAIVDFLPTPAELPGVEATMGDVVVTRHCSDDEPVSALAFEAMDEPAVGHLTFVRVFSGVLSTGAEVLNTVSGGVEKIGRMVRMHADRREEVTEALAGDIVALADLAHTKTGDTLSDPTAPIVFDRTPTRAPGAQHPTRASGAQH